jgi:hypothetical protein
MSGEWTGGGANRYWQRPGYRGGVIDDPERDARLYAAMANERFFCETCTGVHPLAEHRLCRDGRAAEIRAGRQTSPADAARAMLTTALGRQP